MGLSQLLMGLANNAVIPLEHKMTQVYGVSEGRVSTSIILSFLVFSLANFPANHIIDTHGLRVAFLTGTALYTAGMLLYLLIDSSYFFVIAGTVLMGLGQPFLMNSPAKVAAFWFFPKNVRRIICSAL
jgi:FLVCR family feline leukemia virus subgroup C receptor-related protein